MSLLSDFIKGDKRALERIYVKYYRRIYYLALKFTGDQTEAEDLVHDIFLKFYNTRTGLSDEVTVEAQLVRIAKFYIFDTLKKKKRFYPSGTLHLPDNPEPSDDENPELQKRQRQKLFMAMEVLPAKCKEIFTLHKIEGLTRAEIANYKNISVKTVENQLTKAFKILKKQLRSV
ncbi:sigma-70 family RNA polymerase sigma factor [Sinomicrobium kalidii]|uniref:RNA polymerase sigma factor n=1 Tax=Sinomicrobium kalidii TaxID=2900738 RepID=UPI001E362202|nr:sigma-70 family RNA polymerase sigma factor [Sinomicrobium kalidii]UGU16460.1 sigma-70 family RNA polymerase sigma factor [Sinomicrobium kalidii]